MTAPKRKLIEVALPLEAINRASAREKSIRHGHPSTLHLWWARRPLAACRAVLFAQLVDDPSARPEEFPTEEEQIAERKRLFELIEKLVEWENRNNEGLIDDAHKEILKSTGGEPPKIVDPFAGGGSIPLEAQRLGLDVEASDLNPVAVLINKALIEIPPKWFGHGPVFPGSAESQLGAWPGVKGLAEDVQRYGGWVRDQVERRIGHLYPDATLSDGSTAKVIAWIWARTVKCPNPGCGITMPLVRSFWLGKKKGKESYLVPRVAGDRIAFDVANDPHRAPKDEGSGTITRTGARCLACSSAVPLAYIRAEGKAGRIGSQLIAMAVEGVRRRVYFPATNDHQRAADVRAPEDIPDSELPKAALGFRVQGYGMARHVDLFTPRQLTALCTFSDVIKEAHEKVVKDACNVGMPVGVSLDAGGTSALAYADSVVIYLAAALSKIVDMSNSLVRWKPSMDQAINLFARQAIPMVWDYAETPVLSDRHAGGFTVALRNLAKSIPFARNEGVVRQADAANRSYRDALVSTDPPYYDNVGYADLSDFFYVWIRRSIGTFLPSLLATILTPKDQELVADPARRGGALAANRYFENGFVQVFQNVCRDARVDFPMVVFYAFKQAETVDEGIASTGWEVLLEGMIRSGWEITATWPIRTELGNRMRSYRSNALASSIVLAGRPRASLAEATSRRGFLSGLREDLPGALRALQQASVAPVDLAQAAIGPGMALFSRYSRIIEADGSDMTVRTALALINHALDEVLAEQEGDFDADTRFCIKWFGQFGWNEASSGESDVLARATNTSVSGLIRGGVFRAVAGKAQLLGPDELNEDWDPLTDERISDWEVVVRLAKALDERGAGAASDLMRRARQRRDLDTAKELAYLLFSLAEKKGWTQTAILFNGLGTAWNDLESAARSSAGRPQGSQGEISFDIEES